MRLKRSTGAKNSVSMWLHRLNRNKKFLLISVDVLLVVSAARSHLLLWQRTDNTHQLILQSEEVHLSRPTLPPLPSAVHFYIVFRSFWAGLLFSNKKKQNKIFSGIMVKTFRNTFEDYYDVLLSDYASLQTNLPSFVFSQNEAVQTAPSMII